MTEVVILLPGIMGSELHSAAGELIWPGAPSELLFPYPDSKMKQLLDPGLQVGDIIRHVSVSNQYASLIDALGSCGFTEAGVKPTLMVCPYDWRKDNALAAERLADKVKQSRQNHGVDAVINLVAHSMGGLVSRYLLESGKYDDATCPGFANVKRLITIGTPHRGAPLALCAALGQIKRLFLSAKQVKELASKPDFPSLYQLMPPEGEPFVWNTDTSARLSPANVYEADVLAMLGLVPANTASAKTFHSHLNAASRPQHVEYFCFCGTRQNTIGNVQADFSPVDADGNAKSRGINPIGVEIADGGDGTVPGWSSSFPGMQQLAVGGDHGGLYKTPEVLRTMGALLGKPGVLSVDLKPHLVRLSLRDEVVDANSRAPVVLFMGVTPLPDLKAELVLRQLTRSDGVTLVQPQDVQKFPVSYQGAPIDSLALTIAAPQYAGVYELDLLKDGTSIALNRPNLLVQFV